MTDIGPCAIAEGKATYHDSVVTLSNFPTPDNCGMTNRLFLVRWGKRTYMIPSQSVANFMQSVSSGQEPRTSRYGQWLLREYDWNEDAIGVPNVPR